MMEHNLSAGTGISGSQQHLHHTQGRAVSPSLASEVTDSSVAYGGLSPLRAVGGAPGAAWGTTYGYEARNEKSGRPAGPPVARSHVANLPSVSSLEDASGRGVSALPYEASHVSTSSSGARRPNNRELDGGPAPPVTEVLGQDVVLPPEYGEVFPDGRRVSNRPMPSPASPGERRPLPQPGQV